MRRNQYLVALVVVTSLSVAGWWAMQATAAIEAPLGFVTPFTVTHAEMEPQLSNVYAALGDTAGDQTIVLARAGTSINATVCNVGTNGASGGDLEALRVMLKNHPDDAWSGWLTDAWLGDWTSANNDYLTFGGVELTFVSATGPHEVTYGQCGQFHATPGPAYAMQFQAITTNGGAGFTVRGSIGRN